MPRGRRIARPTSPAATSTWGRREIIRAGIHTAESTPDQPQTGIGPDIGVRKRLFDVRMNTAAPGNISKPFTLYVTSRAFYDPSFEANGGVPTAAVASATLFAFLETGGGGVTRAEEFILPQHGKAIHIGADSVRLFVVFEPNEVSIVPDNATAMIGFELNATVSLSGLYPGEVRTETFNPLVAGVPLLTPIPNFSTTLQMFHPSLSMLEVNFVDVFGVDLSASTTFNGSDFAEPFPIPLGAAQVSIEFPGGGGPIATGRPILRWDRPS